MRKTTNVVIGITNVIDLILEYVIVGAVLSSMVIEALIASGSYKGKNILNFFLVEFSNSKLFIILVLIWCIPHIFWLYTDTKSKSAKDDILPYILENSHCVGYAYLCDLPLKYIEDKFYTDESTIKQIVANSDIPILFEL